MWMQTPLSVQQQQQQQSQQPHSHPPQPFQSNMAMPSMQPAFQQQYSQANLIDALSSNPNMPPTTQQSTPPSIRSPQNNQTVQKQKEDRLDTAYKRQADGPVLWFAGPPLNINKLEDSNTPVHSMAYLKWKREQNEAKD